MKLLRNLTPALLVLALASCGGKKETATTDITAEVKKFYAETKNDKGEPFFRNKEIKDLPADLKWEDGAEQQDFGSPDAKKGGTYRHYITDYPRTLRTIGPDSNDTFRGYLLDYFSIALLGKQPDTFKYIPGVAKQWARGADKKTFYFKIDPDAHFSDGEKVTADNFFFTFFFMRYEPNQASWQHDFYRTKFDNITKFDDLTISITVNSAKPDAIDYASISPQPIGFYKGLNKDYLQAYNWKFAPTMGAYEIKESGLKKGQSVTLTHVKNWWAQNKKFYRQLFNPERIQLEVVRDPDKVVELFKTGTAFDVMRIRSPEIWHKQLPDNDPLVEKGYICKATFYNQVPRPTFGFWINTSRPLLGNHDVREGIQYACNWDLVCKQVFYGDYERLNLAEEGFREFTDPSIKARPFDPAKAAEFFGKAGFTERGPDGIFKKPDGTRLSFTITNSYKRFESALVVIQQEAKKAGLELNIETPESTAAFKKMNEKQHDLAFTAYNVSVEMYPRFWEDFHGDNAYEKDGKPKTDTNNLTCYSDKETDAMITRYDKSEDVNEIKDLAWKLERRIHDAAVFVPAFQFPYYQCAFWRWFKWPAHFDSRTSRDFEETWAFWIDEDERKATLDAMKEGKTFPKSVKVYDQWRQK
jgi:microcin C transport system substrate-binding protein